MSIIGTESGASPGQNRNPHNRSGRSGFREPTRRGRGALLSFIIPGKETARFVVHLKRLPNSESLPRPHDQDPKRLLREKSPVAGSELKQLLPLTGRYLCRDGPESAGEGFQLSIRQG